jgi:hypothetical protein
VLARGSAAGDAVASVNVLWAWRNFRTGSGTSTDVAAALISAFLSI